VCLADVKTELLCVVCIARDPPKADLKRISTAAGPARHDADPRLSASGREGAETSQLDALTARQPGRDLAQKNYLVFHAVSCCVTA
jgi:hypothetical protein